MQHRVNKILNKMSSFDDDNTTDFSGTNDKLFRSTQMKSKSSFNKHSFENIKFTKGHQLGFETNGFVTARQMQKTNEGQFKMGRMPL